MFDSIEGLRAANAAGQMLQAWKAGPETVALRRQLEAMPDGGVYAITIPERRTAARPGPYERACQVAWYFKNAKPRSKVLILDANPDVTSKGALFKKVWAEQYRGIVEYRPSTRWWRSTRAPALIKFEVQDDVKASVLNVLPPMRAGTIARAGRAWPTWPTTAGAASNYQTFESTAAKDVHVLGDSIQIAPAMPKSGHMANSHGKVAAAAIVAQLSGWAGQPGADAHQHLLQLRRRPQRDPRGQRARVRGGREDLQDRGRLRRREPGADRAGRRLRLELGAATSGPTAWAEQPLRQWPDDAPALPLWRQLQAAASVLAAVRRGESATPALARVPAELRPAAQALAFHALRQLGRAEALRRQLAKRAAAARGRRLLCTALALAWREEGAPYRRFTLVDQAVEAAKRAPDTGRSRPSSTPACAASCASATRWWRPPTRDPVARWNHPRWWIERLRQDHPQHWQAILAANNAPAPMTLRVNAPQIARRPTCRRCWPQPASQRTPVGAHGLLLARPRPVHAHARLRRGPACRCRTPARSWPRRCCWTAWPRRRRPLRVLDACAAPGGKTAHLLRAVADAERAGAGRRPGALRAHPPEPATAWACRPRCVAADAAEPGGWWDGQPFDAILLDAPCTASGIVRRHPDVRWLRRESDIAQLAGSSRRAARLRCGRCCKPGGRLLYCTCSVFRAEGERADRSVSCAQQRRPVLRPGPGHLMPQTGAKRRGRPGQSARVTTTASSTRCWKRVHWMHRPAGCLSGSCGLPGRCCWRCCWRRLAGPGAGRRAEVTQLRVERTDEGVLLSATVRFELPPVVEDALAKGIPMFFVAEAVASTATAGTGTTSAWPAPRATCAWPTSRSPGAGGCRCRPRRSASSGLVAGPELRHARGGAGRRAARLALAHRRRRRARPGRHATTWTSASGSTCRSCRGRSRSARSARPTGTSRPCATQRLAAGERRGEHAAPARRPARASCCRARARCAGRSAWASRWSIGHRHRADVPADAGHQQPRAVRAQLRAPVRAQHGGGRRAAAGDPAGWRAPGLARCGAASSAAGCWSSWRPSSRWWAWCPGVLIYVVSYQFVSRSIESWFDVKVEGALDAGLNLGRATLDTLANDLANKTRAAGNAAGRDARHLAPAWRWSACANSSAPTTWCSGAAPAS